MALETIFRKIKNVIDQYCLMRANKLPTIWRKKTSWKLSVMMIIQNYFRHMKNRDQLLIIPLTIWSGIEQGFFGADFTAVGFIYLIMLFFLFGIIFLPSKYDYCWYKIYYYFFVYTIHCFIIKLTNILSAKYVFCECIILLLCEVILENIKLTS